MTSAEAALAAGAELGYPVALKSSGIDVEWATRRLRRGEEDLLDDLVLDWPCARIDGAWLTFGFDERLDRAARIAVDGMIALMGREHGLGPEDALGLASIVVDLRVTQVVNGQLGVHAVLCDDAWS